MTVGAPIFYPASPIAIRDGTADRLAAVPGLTGVYKARTTPGQDSQLPYAAVWHAGERTSPWGDGNVGEPTFEHNLRLVVDVMAKAGDEHSVDVDIITLVDAIRATLLTDPTWVHLFEGIERCDTRYAYPTQANDIVVQAIIEFEVTFKSAWPPVVPNALKTVAVSLPPGQFDGLAVEFDKLDQ